MEPIESGANGRGRRKRRLPLDQAEGGGSAQIRVGKTAGPREEDSVGRLSDRLNMCVTSHSSKAGADMSAMRVAQGRVSLIDPNPNVLDGQFRASEIIRPCSRGEQGRSLKEEDLSQKGRGQARRERSARQRPCPYRSVRLRASIGLAAWQTCGECMTVSMLAIWRGPGAKCTG